MIILKDHNKRFYRSNTGKLHIGVKWTQGQKAVAVCRLDIPLNFTGLREADEEDVCKHCLAVIQRRGK